MRGMSGRWWALISAGILALGAEVFANEATSGDRDYHVIIDRNPFGLKPPPPPATNAPPPSLPKDEIFLTGITSIGVTRAYFMTKPPSGKPPDYYGLGVDEKKNELEVLAIDLANKSVKVRNGGIESVMTFAANGIKAPSPPATAPPGAGVVNGAVVTPPMPGAGVAGNPANTPPGSATITGGAATPGTGRTRTIPSRGARTPAVNATPPPGFNPNERPDPNAGVQDVLMMELQKRARPDVTFPPTPMPQ